MKLLMTTIAASVLFSGAAFAEQRTTYSKLTTSDDPIAEKVGPQPYDFSNINQSPIRGEGRISVVHNEPAPGDKAAEITKARWLLQDNNWTCRPNDRVGRR